MVIPENSSRELFRENFVKSINFLNRKARKEAFKRSRDLDKIFANACMHIKRCQIKGNNKGGPFYGIFKGSEPRDSRTLIRNLRRNRDFLACMHAHD